MIEVLVLLTFDFRPSVGQIEDHYMCCAVAIGLAFVRSFVIY